MRQHSQKSVKYMKEISLYKNKLLEERDEL